MADNKYTIQDLQDNLNYLNDTKTLIKQAIIDKGQEVSEDDTFRSYANKIEAIETGVDTSDATATANDILAPKTAYENGEKITGVMIPKYEPTGDVSYSDSNSIAVKSSIQNSTKVLVDGYRLCLSDSNINVYNPEMQLVNSYSLSSFGIDSSRAYKSLDACDYVDDTGSILVVLAYSYAEGWGRRFCYRFYAIL